MDPIETEGPGSDIRRVRKGAKDIQTIPGSVLSSGLHPLTTSEADRIVSAGGTIEDGLKANLIDPIVQTLDNAGELPNLVFLGAAGAREVISGSVATLYDWSGNANDATQGTSSARPTDGTLNGRVACDFDATDDILVASFSATSGAKTFFCVAEYRSLSGGPNPGLWCYVGSARDWTQLLDADDGDLWGRLQQSDGTEVNFDQANGPALNADTPFHVVQRANGIDTATQRQNGQQVDSVAYDGTIHDTTDLLLGNQNNAVSSSEPWDGPIPFWLSLESYLSDSVVSEIEGIYTNYYNL